MYTLQPNPAELTVNEEAMLPKKKQTLEKIKILYVHGNIQVVHVEQSQLKTSETLELYKNDSHRR